MYSMVVITEKTRRLFETNEGDLLNSKTMIISGG